MQRVHELVLKAALNRGDCLALIDHADQTYSWQAMWDAIQDAGDALKEVGVSPGDRVVLVLENTVDVLAFFFAASTLDAMAVAVNARMTEAELNRIIDHCDPSAILCATSVSADARAHAERLGAKKVTGRFGAAALVVRAGSRPEAVSADATEQVALLLYTSGTTGSPKAAMLTHGNLLAAANASMILRGMRSSDMSYLALPLSHIFGIVVMLAVCKAQGALRLEPRFSVERLYDALQKDVTLLPAVPQMHAHLFHYAREKGIAKYQGGPLRYVSSGGAPLDPNWKREAEAFYGLPLQNGYGLTECAAGVCATSSAISDPDVSVGLPMTDMNVSLDFDAPGALQDEGIGEILVRGPQVMKGYFRDPEQTAKALTEDGAFRTGDLGKVDDKGRFHIVGRTKELIIRSGFNVYPVEVEAALTDHPDVVVAAVVGRAVQGNEEVLAFVKAGSAGLSAEVLHTHCKAVLAPYKCPTHIVISDVLPAAPTGKILKAELIPHFAAELAALDAGKS